MIYTKRKAGYHMEKSDILTASLPDANDETADHSTILMMFPNNCSENATASDSSDQ